jgi:malonyl-CoA decarboxylase
MNPLALSLQRVVSGLVSKTDLNHLQNATRTSLNAVVGDLLGPHDAQLEALLRLRAHIATDADLKPLHQRLGVALSTSFEEKRLVLRRLTTTNTSKPVLERVLKASAVLHEIRSIEEARTRFDGDHKRAFALFHRAIDWPLVLVEVSLVNTFADRLSPLLCADPAWHSGVTTHAILYSIISQESAALTQLNVGRTLVRSVLNLVQPGVLRNAVNVELSESEDGRRRLNEIRVVSTLSPVVGFERFASTLPTNLTREQALREYILRAPESQRCPVSRFHLGNGARVERLLPFGNDTKEKKACMVNYRYIASEMDSHSFNFEQNNLIATANGDV